MTELGESIERALTGRGFPAYEGSAPDHTALRRELFTLLDRALATDVSDAQHQRLRDAIGQHLAQDITQQRYYDGVSAARADRDTTWEQEVARVLARSKDVGAVHLELGTWTAFPDERTRQLAEAEGLAEFIRLDFDDEYELDVVADARALPFADNSIDRVRADSVLEHIPHPHPVIHECFRVLRPGGAMIFATPFVFNLHGYPDDYLRYTPSWYSTICQEAGFDPVVLDIDAARGLYYTLHNSAKAAVVDEADPAAPALRTLHLLVTELLGALVPLDNGFRNGARQWFHSVQCLAIKPGRYEPSRRPRDWDRPFAERALDLLVSPDTHEPLQLQGNVLVAPNGKRYHVRGGRPDFMGAPVKREPAAPVEQLSAARRLRYRLGRVRRRLRRLRRR
jgi:SAM-dependent methyltransferase